MAAPTPAGRAETYLDHLIGTGLRPKTVADYMREMRRVYMWRGDTFAAVNRLLKHDDLSDWDFADIWDEVAGHFGRTTPEFYRIGWWDGFKVARVFEPRRWEAVA